MESEKHFKAKLRAMQILKDVLRCDLYSIEEPKEGNSFGVDKTFSLDAYGELRIKIGIEIDGKCNHGTRITIAKDKYRAQSCQLVDNTYTVRFTPDDFVGDRKLTDNEILSEIRWSLKNQGMLLL
jgi:hypothetical protein